MYTIRILLRCRMCSRSELFDNVDAANASWWSNISPLGAMKTDGVRVHNANCPNHTPERIEDTIVHEMPNITSVRSPVESVKYLSDKDTTTDE